MRMRGRRDGVVRIDVRRDGKERSKVILHGRVKRDGVVRCNEREHCVKR